MTRVLAYCLLALLVGTGSLAESPRDGTGETCEEVTCVGEQGPPGLPGICECNEVTVERPPCRLRFHAVSAQNPCNIRRTGKRAKLVVEDTVTAEKWQFRIGGDGKKPAGLEALVAALSERSWCIEGDGD